MFVSAVRSFLILTAVCVILPLGAQDLGESIRQAQQTHGDIASGTPSLPGSPREHASGLRLKDTPVYKLFDKYPAGNTPHPEYPKIALSFSYPNWINEGDIALGRAKANQCLKYALTYWENSKSSKRYDDLTVCPSEFSRVSHTGLRSIWPSFGIPGQTTGQSRTDGPLPPRYSFPTDENSQRWIMHGGAFYLGAVLIGLGYDWNYSEDKRRVWVVKVGNIGPAPAEAIPTDALPQNNNGETSTSLAARCSTQNFTQDRFERIKAGMTLEQVSQIIGCQPDPEFTRRSQATILYMWALHERTLVAAKSIRVFFNPKTEKAMSNSMFKSAEGF